MIAIMRDALGVGLAATQLGILRRLLVFQAGPDATPTALVNPEIEWLSDELAIAEEGCLSLPGVASTSSARCTPGSAASTSTASRSWSRPRASRRASSSTRSTTSTAS